MKQQLSDKKLENILDFSEMLKLFKYFSRITGVDVALYDTQGEEKLSYRMDKSLCLCNLVGEDTECRVNMRYAAEKAAELGEPYIFKCGCIVKCSVPVIFEDKLVGSVAFGPLLLWDADELVREELRRFISLKSPEIKNLDKVIGYLRQMEPDTMTSAAQILFITVNNLSKAESKYLNERNKIYNQQRRIGDAIIEHKLSKTPTINYSIDIEKKLIAYVQMGDTRNAKRVLNDVMGEIVTSNLGNLEAFKAKLYELTAILMRAAVDVGAPLEQMSEYIAYYTRILAENTTLEELCHMTSEIMDVFIRLVYEHRSSNQENKHLADAINYIRTHYMEEIGLAAVADKIYINRYYLSHMFRSELNTTFKDYLNKIRMDESLRLLRGGGLKVQEVAYAVGYCDPNYFTKAFKKHYSMSPKKFMLSSQYNEEE